MRKQLAHTLFVAATAVFMIAQTAPRLRL